MDEFLPFNINVHLLYFLREEKYYKIKMWNT